VGEMTQTARDGFRERFLLACYRKHEMALVYEAQGGPIGVGQALAEEERLDAADAWDAYNFCAQRGYISNTTRGGSGRVTAAGQDYVEGLLRRREANARVASPHAKPDKKERFFGSWIRTNDRCGKGGQGDLFIAYASDD